MKQPRRSTASIRYAFDKWNRLLILPPKNALRPLHIVDGRFGVTGRNRLTYHVDSSNAQDHQLPRTIELEGDWALTDRHDLVFALHQNRQFAKQSLYFKGALLQAKANALVVALRDNRVSLSGRWAADDKNRLTFLVDKADGAEDRLTLQGNWEVGKRHELLYRYRQRVKTSGPADERTLIFAGGWDVTATDRLAYRIAGSDDSAFEFKASLKSPSLLAREGRIIYEVGIGVAKTRLERRQVLLFGTWKLHKDLSISFELPSSNGRVHAFKFQGTARLNSRNQVAVSLQNNRHEPLGLTVLFTHDIVRDAGLFLRLKKSAEEDSLIGGLQVRF